MKVIIIIIIIIIIVISVIKITIKNTITITRQVAPPEVLRRQLGQRLDHLVRVGLGGGLAGHLSAPA